MDENGNAQMPLYGLPDLGYNYGEPIAANETETFVVDDYGTLTVGTARDLISDSPTTGDESDGEAFREYLNSNEVVCEVPYQMRDSIVSRGYLVEGHVKIIVDGGFASFIQGKVISDNEISLDATEMIGAANYGVYDTVEEAIAVAKNVVCHSKKDDGCAVPYEAVIYSIYRGVQTEMMTVVPDTQNEEQLVWEDLFEVEGASE